MPVGRPVDLILKSSSFPSPADSKRTNNDKTVFLPEFRSTGTH